MSRLRITEIFYSLQGEGRSSGWPTVFIRLTGCPLRCAYCDTKYAFTGGQWMELDTILGKLESWNTRYVTVTGGEPLAQKACPELLEQLADSGFFVSLETSGALDISQIEPRVVKVMDIKTPSSGEAEKNRDQNVEHLRPQDQVKFVVGGRADFDWARGRIEKFSLNTRCEVLISPVYGAQDPAQLAKWILEEQLPVRFQLQLHKILWGDERGR